MDCKTHTHIYKYTICIIEGLRRVVFFTQHFNEQIANQTIRFLHVHIYYVISIINITVSVFYRLQLGLCCYVVFNIILYIVYILCIVQYYKRIQLNSK